MRGEQSGAHGAAPFVCAYINKQVGIPPLLLSLDGLYDVAELLEAATSALRRGGMPDIDPKVAFTPDGAVVSKATKARDILPNSVLILSCGEAFDAATVPERARRMYASQQRQSQKLAPLVRAEQSLLREPTLTPKGSPRQQPWRFSPSGRWSSPLALRPG